MALKDADVLKIAGIEVDNLPQHEDWFDADMVLRLNELHNALEAAGRYDALFSPALKIMAIQYARFMRAAEGVISKGDDRHAAALELQNASNSVWRCLRDMHMTANGAAILKKPAESSERDMAKFFAG